MFLINTYTDQHVRIWVRWSRSDELEEMGGYMEGTPPGWWENEGGWHTELDEVSGHSVS